MASSSGHFVRTQPQRRTVTSADVDLAQCWDSAVWSVVVVLPSISSWIWPYCAAGRVLPDRADGLQRPRGCRGRPSHLVDRSVAVAIRVRLHLFGVARRVQDPLCAEHRPARWSPADAAQMAQPRDESPSQRTRGKSSRISGSRTAPTKPNGATETKNCGSSTRVGLPRQPGPAVPSSHPSRPTTASPAVKESNSCLVIRSPLISRRCTSRRTGMTCQHLLQRGDLVDWCTGASAGSPPTDGPPARWRSPGPPARGRSTRSGRRARRPSP